jgi:hypothetical protein
MPRLSLFILLALGACGPRPDLVADRAELLRLHEQARTAHLEKRVDLMAFPDSLLEIARGSVKVRSAADNAARFRAYFDRSTFAEWADLASPIIRISPDGQMAYVVVQKSVRLTAPDSSGVARPEHTIYAWLEVYEKRHGTWTLAVVVSTDRPGEA